MKRAIYNKITIVGFLAISALAISPLVANGAYEARVDGYNSGPWTSNIPTNNEAPKKNPEPSVSSINPSSGNFGEGGKRVTIAGKGFVPNSVARVNGSDRPTTFIDYSHLMVDLNANDMRASGGHYITVFNPAPAGGYSEAAFFTINGNPMQNGQSNNSQGTVSYGNTGSTVSNSTNQGYKLAASAIVGSGSFMPSGIIQWIFFAILVLLIVILVRRIFRADEKYFAAPLKHS